MDVPGEIVVTKDFQICPSHSNSANDINIETSGLTIDDHLSWKPHVLKISNNISRTLGIMCRPKNFLPTHVLRILYNSLILPHLQYSILAWGFRMGRYDKLQKRAACITTRSKYNSHTDPLFRKLNLLKAKDLFELNVLKLFYKYKKKSLPFYLSNMFSDFTSLHGYELRTTYILKDVGSNMSSENNCIPHYLPVVINDLKNDILNKNRNPFSLWFCILYKDNMVKRI